MKLQVVSAGRPAGHAKLVTVPLNPERAVMLMGTFTDWPAVTVNWLEPGAMEKSGTLMLTAGE